MKIFKGVITRMLSALGYELNRSTGPRVSFDNFVSLAQAYEQRLHESGHFVPANEGRPRLLGRLRGTPPSEAYFLIEALARCKDIEGDVCEFGVAQGETSALIANEIAPAGHKRLHLFDSFAGLPRPSEKDELKDDIFSLGSMDAYTGTMASPERLVRARLEAISFPAHRWAIHRGSIEQVLQKDQNLPDKVCFAYVDFDYYEPTKIALEFLHRITSSGAILIVDDYDFFSTGAKAAVDEFTRDKHSCETPYACFVPDTRYGHFAVLTRK
jgi:O-methyltransferase